MSKIVFDNVNKVYNNNVQAVFDFNLEVKDKEFIVLVGPSGCGKSTTLRMLAGLEEITDGTISIDDKVVNMVHPKDRDIAMVFQNYALYPHMNVFDNMAFSLRLRAVPVPVLDENGNKIYEIDEKEIRNCEFVIDTLDEEKNADKIQELKERIEYLKKNPTALKVTYRHYSKEEIAARVNAAAETLGLTHYLKRKPAALSGGQRQRVALGRAIVREPKVFLMDEPLSNLDAKLRVQMRSEIIKIHERVGAITIYVTHDQTEAMTMADRIVVMKDGYIQQIGTPKEVYNYPSNMFVGSFIGAPSMNFLNGTYQDGKFVTEKTDDEESVSISLNEEQKKVLKGYEGKPVVIGIRPEDIYLTTDDFKKEKTNPIDLACDISELLGHELIVYSYIGQQRIIIKTSANNEIDKEGKFAVCFDMSKIHFFDPETTLRIAGK